MKIDFHKHFRKHLIHLSPNQKLRVAEALKLFEQNPYHPMLHNHALHGKHKGHRAIAPGGDLRLVFQEEDHYESVIFLSVGTHNQVY